MPEESDKINAKWTAKLREYISTEYPENLLWNYNLLLWLLTMQNSINVFQVQGWSIKEQVKLFN